MSGLQTVTGDGMQEEIPRIPLLVPLPEMVNNSDLDSILHAHESNLCFMSWTHTAYYMASLHAVHDHILHLCALQESIISPLDRRSEAYRHAAAEVVAKKPVPTALKRQSIITLPNVLTFARLVMGRWSQSHGGCIGPGAACFAITFGQPRPCQRAKISANVLP